jgi:hypothetical protein
MQFKAWLQASKTAVEKKELSKLEKRLREAEVAGVLRKHGPARVAALVGLVKKRRFMDRLGAGPRRGSAPAAAGMLEREGPTPVERRAKEQQVSTSPPAV